MTILDHLTPRQREAVIHLSNGLKSKDIALSMGISYGLVRTYIRCAASRLRGCNLYITNDIELIEAIRRECSPTPNQQACGIGV